ncbi:MAG TPA: hypothetical protein VIS48_14550 [Candidatus Kryptonia bacterium]
MPRKFSLSSTGRHSCPIVITCPTTLTERVDPDAMPMRAGGYFQSEVTSTNSLTVIPVRPQDRRPDRGDVLLAGIYLHSPPWIPDAALRHAAYSYRIIERHRSIRE